MNTGKTFTVQKLGPYCSISRSPEPNYHQGIRWRIGDQQRQALGRSFLGTMFTWIKMKVNV